MEETAVKTNRSISQKILCLGLALFFVSLAQLALAEAIKFNANVFYEKAVPMSGVGYGEWAEILKKESNGALEAKVFYGGVLAPPNASLTAVSDGLAEVGHIPAMYTPSDLPVSNLLHELSANFTDSMAIMAALTEYNFTNKELQDQYKKWNLFFAGAYSTPEYRIFSAKKKSPRSIEMKGKKIRTLGAGSALLVEQMGGIPVNVPSSEMYSGLEKGILDCAANAVSDLKARSLWDVSQHTTLISLGIFYVGRVGCSHQPVGKNGRPCTKSVPEVMRPEHARIYQEYKASNETVMKEAADHGVTFHEPSQEMADLIKEFEVNNIQRAIAVGKEKGMVADPEKFIGDFLSLYEKWVKLLADVDRDNSEAVADILMTEIYDKVDVSTYPN